MARVDFYVLPEEGVEVIWRYACRLAEKAAALGHRIFVRTASPADAGRLDELLWTFNDRSFLPHEIATAHSPAHEKVAVLLGQEPAPPGYRQLLINLSAELPADVDQYERIAEIVDNDPERKRQARERFRQYRERGCTLESHNVPGTG